MNDIKKLEESNVEESMDGMDKENATELEEALVSKGEEVANYYEAESRQFSGCGD